VRSPLHFGHADASVGANLCLCLCLCVSVFASVCVTVSVRGSLFVSVYVSLLASTPWMEDQSLHVAFVANPV